MKSITNVQYIATYIYRNPGSTYTQILSALHAWKGLKAYDEWGQRNQWGNQYFNSYSSTGYVAKGRYWQKVNPNNRLSGYVLTLAGLQKVCLQKPLPPHRSNMENI